MKKLLLLLTIISHFAFGQNNSPQYNLTTKKTTQYTGVVPKAPVWSATDSVNTKSPIFKFETGRVKFKNLATTTDTTNYNKVLVLSGDSLRQMSRSYFGGSTIDTTKVGRIEQGRGTAPIFMYFNGTSWVRNDTSYIPRSGASNITGGLKSNQGYFELGLNTNNNQLQFSDEVYTQIFSGNAGTGVVGKAKAISSSLGAVEVGVDNLSNSGYSRLLTIGGSNTTTPDLSFKLDKGIAYYNGDYSAQMETSQNLIPSLKKVKQLIRDSISGGGTVNASNGLSLAGDTVKLGGTLNDTTIINTNNNTLTLAALSTDANKVVLSVTSDGYSILDVNNLGTSDLSLGFNAGIGKTSGSENVIVGKRAAESVSNIDYSNIQGSLAGNGCSSISESILNGYYSGSHVVSGSTLTGIRSGRLDTYGTYNSNLQGYYSGYSSKGFYGCNIFGYYGAVNLGNAVPLSNSILIGNNTAYNDNVNTTTGGIIHIGNYTHTGGFNNTIAIGDSATNTKTNQVVFAPKYRHLRLRGVDYELPATQGGVDTYLKNNGSGVLSWATVSGGGGTVTSVTSANTDISVANTTTTPVLTLNTGSGANQIVKRDGSGNLNATTVTTNANLTGVITSIGNATSIASQTGTGSTFAMSATPTFTTNITTPLIIGGTSTTSGITYKSTTGVGTTGADHTFQVGNNGATTAMTITNSAMVGIGTNAPVAQLHLSSDVTSSTRGLVIDQHSTDAASAPVFYRKSRGTLLSSTTVADQDYIGVSSFTPYDGASYLQTVGFGGRVNGTVTAGSVPTDLFFYTGSTNLTNPYVSGNVRIVINSSGNVGIGTTSPQSKLDVEGAVSIGATYSGTTAAPANGLLVEGLVGIGTSNPTVSLDVSSKTDAIRIANGTTAQRTTAASGLFRFNTTTSRFEGNDGTSWNTFTESIFPIMCSAPASTYAASTTYYMGSAAFTGTLTSTANQRVMQIPFNATLIGASIGTRSGTPGSSETSTVYMRVNNTTDVQLTNTMSFASANTNQYTSALNTDVSAGDTYEVKLTTGAFTAAPATSFVTVMLYFKRR